MRLLIDTDPGLGTPGADPEDGLAILYALNSRDVTVEGITVVAGNVPLGHGWANARRLLTLAGRRDVPLHAGAAGPREPDQRPRQVAWLASRADLTDDLPEASARTAVDFMADTVLGSPGDITLVAIGPLTNVAAAVDAEPRFASSLAGLVIMGGTVRSPGNVTPAAEFNLWMDPEAAAVVFDSGAPITMIGLDVCHQTHFDRERAAGLSTSGSPLSELVGSAAGAWMDVRDLLFDDPDVLHLYDTLAMAAAIEPDLVVVEPAVVAIETSTGPAQGMTVTHLDSPLTAMLTERAHNASVATDVDLDRFEARFTEWVTNQL